MRKTRNVSIVAIPHIRFHMCHQIRFALRATTNARHIAGRRFASYARRLAATACRPSASAMRRSAAQAYRLPATRRDTKAASAAREISRNGGNMSFSCLFVSGFRPAFVTGWRGRPEGSMPTRCAGESRSDSCPSATRRHHYREAIAATARRSWSRVSANTALTLPKYPITPKSLQWLLESAEAK